MYNSFPYSRGSSQELKSQGRSSFHCSRNHSEQVVSERVAEVLRKILDRALPGNVGLQEETEHGKHGEAAVLYLLHLEDGSLVWVLSETQRVKWTTRVEFVLQILTREQREN